MMDQRPWHGDPRHGDPRHGDPRHGDPRHGDRRQATAARRPAAERADDNAAATRPMTTRPMTTRRGKAAHAIPAGGNAASRKAACGLAAKIATGTCRTRPRIRAWRISSGRGSAPRPRATVRPWPPPRSHWPPTPRSAGSPAAYPPCCSRPGRAPRARPAPGWPRRWPAPGSTPGTPGGRRASRPRPRPTPSVGATRRCSPTRWTRSSPSTGGPTRSSIASASPPAWRTRPRTSPTSRPGCRRTCGGSRRAWKSSTARPSAASCARSTCWPPSPDRSAWPSSPHPAAACTRSSPAISTPRGRR